MDSLFYLYQPFFYSIVFIIGFYYSIRFYLSKNKNGNIESVINNKNSRGILLLIFSILFFGLRPATTNYEYSMFFGDTIPYTIGFERILNKGLPDQAKDWGFTLYTYLFSFVGNGQMYLLSISFFTFTSMYIALQRLSKDWGWILYLMYFTSMSFISIGNNIIRTGWATGFFLLGFTTKNKIHQAIFFFMAISIQKTTLIVVLIYYATLFIKKHYIYVLFWLSSFVTSLALGNKLGVLFREFSPIEDDRITSYTIVKKTAYNVGFRIDFILYSLVPILLGFYFIKKGFVNKQYSQILNIYLAANSLWLLLIRIPYSDRLAYLSWSLMPILIIYPLTKQVLFKHQYAYIALAIFLNTSFTLLIYLR